jgi:nucleoside 2-deoxyribosyltransferase
MELLRRCDAIIIVTHEFESSPGTVREIKEASRLGKPIFYRPSSLKAWLEKKEAEEADDSAVTSED